MLGRVRDLVHGLPTGLFDATPVEVVAHIQDVVRVLHRRTGPEGVGHQELRLHVDLWHEAAARSAAGASRIEALHELLMSADQLRVGTVPPAAREDVRAGRVPSRVGNDGRTAAAWTQRSIHAAPITDGENVLDACAIDGDRGPIDSVVSHGRARCPQAPCRGARGVAIAEGGVHGGRGLVDEGGGSAAQRVQGAGGGVRGVGGQTQAHTGQWKKDAHGTALGLRSRQR
mmetsp:Transcript_75448/g.119702  ORF Transcript_75448/g.119702 Transcript_75448/m.119702 type:complete len:229 (-) Transcript_75448:32-718(-)